MALVYLFEELRLCWGGRKGCRSRGVFVLGSIGGFVGAVGGLCGCESDAVMALDLELAVSMMQAG